LPGKHQRRYSGVSVVYFGLRVFGQHPHDCHLCLSHHGALPFLSAAAACFFMLSNKLIQLTSQLLTHKDPHIFPRFEDHRRYAIVVATTSILLFLYGT
jgi:hypothetical protein